MAISCSGQIRKEQLMDGIFICLWVLHIYSRTFSDKAFYTIFSKNIFKSFTEFYMNENLNSSQFWATFYRCHHVWNPEFMTKLFNKIYLQAPQGLQFSQWSSIRKAKFVISMRILWNPTILFRYSTSNICQLINSPQCLFWSLSPKKARDLFYVFLSYTAST